MRWERVPGVRVEPLGEAWVAYSPLSRDTLILTTESAAVLEVLAEGACDEAVLAATLAADGALPVGPVADALVQAREPLVAAGLVRLR